MIEADIVSFPYPLRNLGEKKGGSCVRQDTCRVKTWRGSFAASGPLGASHKTLPRLIRPYGGFVFLRPILEGLRRRCKTT
jgi:hypothetical protein